MTSSPFFRTGNDLYRGWAECVRGHTETGLPRIEAAIVQYIEQRQILGLTHYLTLLAEAQLEAQHIDQGLETIARALVAAQQDYWQNSDALRIQAKLMAARGDESAAIEQVLRSAIDHGAASGAKLTELRAINDLMLHLKPQQRGHELHDEMTRLLADFPVDDIDDVLHARSLLTQH